MHQAIVYTNYNICHIKCNYTILRFQALMGIALWCDRGRLPRSGAQDDAGRLVTSTINIGRENHLLIIENTDLLRSALTDALELTGSKACAIPDGDDPGVVIDSQAGS